MSDKKAPASSTGDSNPGNQKDSNPKDPQQDVPLVTQKAEPKSNFAKAAAGGKPGKSDGKKTTSTPPKTRSTTGSRVWTWFWLFILLLVAAAVAAWYFLPGVHQQVNQQLQGLPVVGKHFRSDTSAGNGAQVKVPAESSASNSVAAESQSTDSSTDSTNDSAPATQTTPQPSPQVSVEQSTPQPVPEQPMLQPGDSRPSATSPVPPPDHSARLIAELRQQLGQQNETIQQLQQQLAGVQRNVTAQGNRLSQLGNASREDWQLAEADYLLRLANQRLMLEQDSRAALGLLQEVDTIVREVDMPDLYGVRQQLARDITALKLVDNVDREGLYLRLRALEEQMVKLNIQPKFDLAKRDAAAAQAQEDNTEVGEAHFRSSWGNFVNFLKDSVRIRDGEIDPVLLSPQSETRFRQSLRLNMEQAELAVLRANETVYKDALSHARQLLMDYGVENPQRQVILRELEELAQNKVEAEFPDLSASQSALRNYIDKMHKVSSGQTPDNDNGGSYP
ncbi:uroporphyrinogen-III C-methyltransferase [Microbulbifer sp. ALW1]|uniref:uroporphyrinogen-III C-methyltransferase n=1 Tax=Microbulbifer sp. (strain ALW1) TaxID=1516059 RepID=UPI00135854C1|nr:uroporphyrinogen-III C-methyltransferase [Microbulbifer sp. ALW1]